MGMYLLVYSLFSDVVCKSDYAYVAVNDRTISE
jgi:hypothetical protein